ncbi:MAG: divergent polysaccharide deacetylase family protein [Gammaproteobacteria bacterium]|nr:divergent polysaccharide deacetylase family protein [Gammaproteobacteria bacterium]MDH5653527.1 divergent polysaccharide deacetylase family protein [Gammaproteobacteria bacterium]
MRRWSAVLLLLIFTPLHADTAPLPPASPPALISIIIDDLGHVYRNSFRAVHLPWPVTVSFLPHAPHSVTLAKQAWLLDKEIMVHLPMEALGNKDIGPGGLKLDMTQEQFAHILQTGLASIPHAGGINNHMGSLLTRDASAMDRLMSHLALERKYFFVDSRTTQQSQALHTARQYGLHTTGRDIFLDHVPDKKSVQQQFNKLIQLARQHGSALAIAHPRPETLEVLHESLPKLAEMGVKLVPVSTLIQYRTQRRLAWQTSSFPLPRAVKSLKQ